MAEFGIQKKQDHSVSVYDEPLKMITSMGEDEEFFARFTTDEEAKLFIAGLRSRGYSKNLKFKATPYKDNNMFCYAITINKEV